MCLSPQVPVTQRCKVPHCAHTRNGGPVSVRSNSIIEKISGKDGRCARNDIVASAVALMEAEKGGILLGTFFDELNTLESALRSAELESAFRFAASLEGELAFETQVVSSAEVQHFSSLEDDADEKTIYPLSVVPIEADVPVQSPPSRNVNASCGGLASSIAVIPKAAPTVVRCCRVSWDQLATVVVRRQHVFRIEARSSGDVPQTAGGDSFAVLMRGCAVSVHCRVDDGQDGSYSVVFKPTIVGSACYHTHSHLACASATLRTTAAAHCMVVHTRMRTRSLVYRRLHGVDHSRW